MLRKQAEKGSALIIAVIFMMLLIASSGVVLMTSSSHYFSNRSYRGTIISQYAARGGLGYVGYTLNMSTAINRIEGKIGDLASVIYTEDGTTWKKLQNNAVVNGSGGTSADETFNRKDQPLKSRGNRHFRVDITPNGTLGYKAHSCASYDRQGYGILAYFTSRKVFESAAGVTGYDRVTITESGVIDSYNSQGGTVPYSATNMNENGDVASNGNIVIENLNDPVTMVYGNVTPGPGCSVTGAEYVAPNHSTTPRATAMTVPSELDTDWLLESTLGTFKEDSDKDTTISSTVHYDKITFHDVLRISGEVTIYCHGDFTANAQGRLIMEPGAKLTLYVSGKFTYNGGFETTSQNPADFIVKSIRDERDPSNTDYGVKVAGESKIIGLIDAPWSNVILTGGAQVFGAVVGYRVTVGGTSKDGLDPRDAKVHYDENLLNMMVGRDQFYLNTTLKGPFKDTP